MPILSIRHKALSRLYSDGEERGLPPDLIAKLLRVLTALDAASEVEEMNVYQGWRLHALRGDLEGYWSISVTGNWRLIFRFEAGNAFDLDLIDYH
jgi:toxin HigB-1